MFDVESYVGTSPPPNGGPPPLSGEAFSLVNFHQQKSQGQRWLAILEQVCRRRKEKGIEMLLELLLERLKAALRVKGNWAVYAAYDPAPFAKREESFLTVGITALETEQAFSDETYWYFPFSAAAQVRLLTAPETDAQVLYDRYWQTVVSGMLSAGCTVQKIRTGAPTEWKQFRKIALEGSFTLSGVFQIAKEEVLAP